MGIASLAGHLSAQTITDQMVAALAKNDIPALLSDFHSMVDLQIPGYNGNYSYNQASMILKKFFKEHPVTSVKITKEGTNSDDSSYSLGKLETGTKTYRLYFVTRKEQNKNNVFLFQLTEIM